MKLEKAHLCIKDYKDAAPSQLEYFNRLTEPFYKSLPRADREHFGHDDGSDHQSPTMTS